ncbi:hypothetical protein [Alloprevotella sp. OH1205_COT-284]|uniref:hypothetical protein n=1 Tax=Alloprevotella sp. OH1205_COT-284 TaxID=2491043 RepID=UPI000F5E8693|nr:hypothetical protein [Alloprevotella sp. OH1205_COT-284]
MKTAVFRTKGAEASEGKKRFCLHQRHIDFQTLGGNEKLLPSLAFARNELRINEIIVFAKAKRQKQKNRGKNVENGRFHRRRDDGGSRSRAAVAEAAYGGVTGSRERREKMHLRG